MFRSLKRRLERLEAASSPSDVQDIKILRDGVFPEADRPADKGEVVCVSKKVAKILIERGDAKPL